MSVVKAIVPVRFCLGCNAKLPHIKPSKLKTGRGKYCSRKCAHANNPLKTLEEKFWERVVKHDKCWEWTGSTHESGYGVICTSREEQDRQLAHRVSWRIHCGTIPEGMQVLHRCDNPPCTNPSHLFLGTVADNMADKVSKGRQDKGTKMLWTKLNIESVIDIRKRFENGSKIRHLAREYGVAENAIRQVVLRISWKHVK